MANITINSDAWTEISITSGTVQNISATADIELSAEQTDNSGVVLKPSEIYQWDNETIYARAVTEDTGALRVVNFKRAAGGGGSYVLPVATASKLGGVKIGSNISIDESGVISTHAPYSLPTAAAETLGGVKVGSNLSIDASGILSATGFGNPVGTIISFMGTSAPTNYLVCDGTAYNITDYQTLADHITAQFGAVDFFGGDGVSTFAVPDLRGEFLRGSGTNSHTNQGSGANVGVHQDGTEHVDYRINPMKSFVLYHSDDGEFASKNRDSSIQASSRAVDSVSTLDTSTEDYFYTSRPTNTSVLYCIKYQ